MLLHNVIRNFIHYLIVTNKSTETVKSYNSDLISFESYLEQKYNCPSYLNEIQVSDIEDYLFYLKQKSLTTASISRNLYTLRSLWNFASKNELCDRNIAASVEPIKIQRKERTFLSLEEATMLITSIEHPLIEVVVQTLFYTGMRISECLNLKLDEVDFNSNIIHVINGKGGKNRNIPINKNLIPVLQNYIKNYRCAINSNYFFATEKSGRLSAPYVNRVLSDTVKKLGWQKHVSAHILRHSFASNLIKNGVNLVYVQKLLGHSNLKVTSIYTHANMEDLDKSINVL